MSEWTLLVAGSRSFRSWRQRPMDNLLNHASYTLDHMVGSIIHGGASGVDSMAGVWAESKDYPVKVYPADWERLGRGAGYVRNAEMVDDADAAIIVWDGESKGTKHTLDLVIAKGIPFVLVKP